MKGMKGPIFQIGIGLWFSLAVMAGIESRSWGAFLAPFYIGLFFVALGLASDARRSGRRPWQVAGNVVIAGCGLLFVGSLMNTAERLYLVNGQSYPRLLARDVGAADKATLDNLHRNQCKGELMEIYGKKGGLWVIRCGFSWVGGHTFVSDTNPYGDKLGGITK